MAGIGSSTADYILSHWRGEQPLAQSFWINLALLRGAIFTVEGIVRPSFSDDTIADLAATLIYVLVVHIIFGAWQIVGVVHACDRYQTSTGAMGIVWATHAGIAISLIFTLVSVFVAFQSAVLKPDKSLETMSAIWERERAARYELRLSEDSAYISFIGHFELGVTKKLTLLLQQNPQVRGIVLASRGGNIYEGRGIAKLIRSAGLDTYVFETCASACTTAFIAGTRRTLGPEGRLGFHQYGFEADYQIPFIDIGEEQNADRAFYRSQNISTAFLDRVFHAAQSDLWFPTREELLDAGVVHRIADKPD